MSYESVGADHRSKGKVTSREHRQGKPGSDYDARLAAKNAAAESAPGDGGKTSGSTFPTTLVILGVAGAAAAYFLFVRKKSFKKNPSYWTPKEERMYKHIKDSYRKGGRSLKKSKELAARTVNKYRSGK